MSENVEQQTTEEVQQPQIELNINDLNAMKNLIDVVTQRGAFKANELSSVGILYDRLSRFLAAAQPQEAAPQPPQGE